MTCPSCGSSLQTETFHGITVDVCPDCQGVWFDRDELRRAKDSADNDLRWLDFDLFGSDVTSPTSEPSSRTCPSCRARLNTLEYEHSQVLIDSCARDHGVWLDHGEWEKLIEYLVTVVNRLELKEYVGKALEELKEVATGPESSFSELRDFLAVWRLLGLRFAVENQTMVETLTQLSRRL